MITMGGYSLPSQDHPRDDRRLDRRHRPGRAPARRLAPHHPHHRGARHGRRRRSSPRTCSSTRSSARTRTARSSAAIARPASAGRSSGTAPATTARRTAWRPQRSRSRLADLTRRSNRRRSLRRRDAALSRLPLLCGVRPTRAARRWRPRGGRANRAVDGTTRATPVSQRVVGNAEPDRTLDRDIRIDQQSLSPTAAIDVRTGRSWQ